MDNFDRYLRIESNIEIIMMRLDSSGISLDLKKEIIGRLNEISNIIYEMC